VTHQDIAFDSNGVLVDGQHRLAAIIEADLPVEMTVFTDVEPDNFDVLDTGEKRNAADVLAEPSGKTGTQARSCWWHSSSSGSPDLSRRL
jgi:hypothetical protein